MRAEHELFKDKVEITLEGRQVFYLFFGGAVIASLVFVLGVMVGKRVEARAHVGETAGTTAASDPLAALDQLGSEPAGDKPPVLTFARELSRPAPEPAHPIEPAPLRAETPPRPVEAKPAEDAADKPEQPKKFKYTLQLSSFKDKAEAEAFLDAVKKKGYEPYLTSAEVE